MAKRVDASSAVLVPAVVHWNVGHFAALVEEREGRYLLKDPVFGGELWMSREAFDDEMSGYALVAAGDATSRLARRCGDGGGRGLGARDDDGDEPDNTKPCSGTTGATRLRLQGQLGDGTYSVHSMMVSLNVVDTPVGLSRQPWGPTVDFTVTYNQRDSFQPQIFTLLEPRDAVDERLDGLPDGQPHEPDAAGDRLPAGRRPGERTLATTRVRAATPSTTVVGRSSCASPRLPSSTSGGWRTAGRGIRPAGRCPRAFPRKVLLTRMIDAQGNALAFTYDASLRPGRRPRTRSGR